MPRLTVFMALAALAAAPLPARAQAGAGMPSARPSRPVDECGKPATARPRRGGQPPAGGATSTTGAAEGPRLLGVPAGSASASSPDGQPASAAAETQASTGTATNPQTAGQATTGTPGTAAAQQGAYSSTGGVNPQASGTSVETAQSSTSAGSEFLSSGAEERVIDPRAARRNRDALRLGIGKLGDKMRLGPAASVSVPTAFGVDAGEMFFGLAYQERTRYTELSDAAAVAGIGIGTRRLVAVEAALTTYSTIRGSVLETGGISFKVHRALPRQISVAAGWENAIRWGGSDDDGSLYAVATKLLNLRQDAQAPFSTAVLTVGLGNGRFRFEDDDAEGRETVNLFAAAGGRVTPHVSLVADWTGQDLNMAASLTPVPRLPVVITLGLADMTGTAGDGARFILSLGYGLAFRQPF